MFYRLSTTIALLAIVGCGGATVPSETTTSPTAAPPATPTTDATTPATAEVAAQPPKVPPVADPAADAQATPDLAPEQFDGPDLAALGDPGIDVLYIPSGRPAMDIWIATLRSGKFLEYLTTLVDYRIKLPRRLPVVVARCGRTNAFYSPGRHMVVLCGELLVHFANTFSKAKNLDEDKPKERDQIVEHVVKAAVFVLFHELGHALVGELELPTTGRNEDVADQAAAWILLTTSNAALSSSIVAAADWLAYEAETKAKAGRPDAYASAHSLDKQRYYNLLCWAYGAAPKQFGALAMKVLPKKRRGRCAREYKQIDRAFSALLKPHMRPSKSQAKRLELLTKLTKDKVPPTADSKACRKAVEHGVTVGVKSHIATLEAEGKMPKDEAAKAALRKKLLPTVNAGLKRGMMLCLTEPWSKRRLACTLASKTSAEIKACDPRPR